MKESELLKQIMVAVSSPTVLVFRNNSGALQDVTGRVVRFGLAPGSADLICVLAPYGRMVALEIKTTRKGSIQSELQKQWQTAVRMHGAVCEVVRSVDEALAVIAQARECRGVQQFTLPKERT